MNAPLPQQSVPLTTAFSLGMESVPLSRDTIAPTLSPIEADIAREEREAEARKTGTPYEIHKELLANTKHVKKDVNQLSFTKWLQDREWPEEHRQKFGPYLMKFFKAHDGWAVKWVPYDEKGKLVPTKANYEVFTFIKKDM